LAVWQLSTQTVAEHWLAEKQTVTARGSERKNKNLAIANISRVSCAHNTL